jgi:hypothetical protein
MWVLHSLLFVQSLLFYYVTSLILLHVMCLYVRMAGAGNDPNWNGFVGLVGNLSEDEQTKAFIKYTPQHGAVIMGCPSAIRMAILRGRLLENGEDLFMLSSLCSN